MESSSACDPRLEDEFLVVQVGGGVILSVATYDFAFHSLIVDRPITAGGIPKVLGEIVELFLELVGHGVFAVAHPKSVAGTQTRSKTKSQPEQLIMKLLSPSFGTCVCVEFTGEERV